MTNAEVPQQKLMVGAFVRYGKDEWVVLDAGNSLVHIGSVVSYDFGFTVTKIVPATSLTKIED